MVFEEGSEYMREKDHSILLKHFNESDIDNFTNTYSNIRIIGNESIIDKFEEYLIIGEIDLHNKVELVAAESDAADLLKMTSHQVILRLYLRYGSNVLNRILGEFSFVIIHTTTLSVVAARDPIGVKTLFFICKNNYFIAASDLYLLRHHADHLNHKYFIQFHLSNGILDSEITPYKAIKRLSRGTYIKKSRHSELHTKKYWCLSFIQEEVNYKNSKDYEEHFFHILSASVESRLIPNEVNSVMMSGGLDSTAIFAIAKTLEKKKNISVIPISAVFDRYRECDERQYIESVLKRYETKGKYIVADDCGIFDNFDERHGFIDEPVTQSISHSFTQLILQGAKDTGATNILTGYGGDHMLNSSLGVVSDMLHQGKIIKALKDVRTYSILKRESFMKNLLYFGVMPSLDRGVSKELKALFDKENIQNFKNIKTFNKKDRFTQLMGTSGHLYMDRVIAPSVGIEINHPFLDKRVVEFLYKCPIDVMWSAEVSKPLLRKSFEAVLPHDVITRTNKTTHIPLIIQGMKSKWSVLYPILKQFRLRELDLISKNEWEDQLLNSKHGQMKHSSIMLLMAMELWLYQHQHKSII